MARRPVKKPKPAPDLPILQLKVRLLDISPSAWRRLLVQASTTLQELHGILQVALGWEGIHLYRFDLRAVGYGSTELALVSPRVVLDTFRLRIGGKLRYTYDMGAFWRHELRVEDRLAAQPDAVYPVCIGGEHPCPPEGCGGPAGYRERQDDLVGWDAWEDLAEMTEVLAAVARDRTTAVLDDPDVRDRFERTLARTRARERFRPKEFSRIQINERFRAEEHKPLMHQQVW
ncbi:plasmid pRiA4b ORF-3 family protein [Azospirillum sp. B510]|uniref:plasmid pRiA4b ORF-3 family protein n=1 Tax=Azospirillum sp. (strain B510) TaxID=137722 RepID=UPI0002FBCD4A|nr:plasmid pRiA4b ORF-3 family protein [Azospirillum sp. B510]